MPNENILPDCRPKMPKSVTRLSGLNWVPIFCANWGTDGGFVPEEHCNFAFYLCDPCALKWSPLVDTMMIPDEVFWNKAREAQLEKYGRELSAPELVEVLKDDTHSLTKLCKDRKTFAKTI